MAGVGHRLSTGCDKLSENEEELMPPEISPAQGVELCAQLEQLCLQYRDVLGVDTVMLQMQMQKLRACLRVEVNNRQMQMTLNRFWLKDGAAHLCSHICNKYHSP